MSLVLTLAGLAACGSTGHREAASAERVSGAGANSGEFRLRDFRLPSGMRVLVEEDRSSPVVGIVNVVGVGSTDDPPGKEGLAHLVEHLTFRAKPSPSANMWSLLAQAGGASVNASTDFDATVFHVQGPRDALADLLTLEGLRIVDPLANLDEATFATEREVVRNELRQRGETNALGAVFAAVQKATFPAAHPYARPIIGTHESLSSITLEDARAFAREHYRPSNMTVVINGDVDLAKVEKLLGSTWSPSLAAAPEGGPVKIGPRLTPLTPAPPEPPPSAGIVEIEGQVPAPELYAAWSLPRGYDDSEYLAQLALGGVREAITNAAMRDQDVVGGLAFVVPGEQASMLVARIILRDGAHAQASADRVLGGLYRAWDQQEDKSPRVAELRFAQRIARMVTATMAEAEGLGARGEKRARFVHFAGDPGLYSRELRALATVSQEQLAAYDRRYVNSSRARVVLVKPFYAGASAVQGRSGLAEAGDDAPARGQAAYDVGSIAKVAIPAGLATGFTTRPLDNGMVVEAARHGSLPLVTIGLAFRSGTAMLARALAHPGRPRHGSFADVGALFTESIGLDEVTFRVVVQPRYLDRALKVLADHVQSLRIHGGGYDYFKTNALPYLRVALARPEPVAERAFMSAMFGSHPYAHASTFEEDLPSEADANRWLSGALSPERAVLAIVGDVDGPSAVEMASDAFKGWDANEPTDAASPPALQEAGRGARFVTDRPGSSQADIMIGCRLPHARADDVTRDRVMAAVVSQRLHAALRAQMGATYGVGAWTTTFRGGSAIMRIRASVENGRLAAALRLVRAELAGADRLEAGDFGAGVWSVARGYNLGLATSDDWVDSALESGVNGWTLVAGDQPPRVLSSFSTAERARAVEALQRCAKEGVVSVVGDHAIATRALAETWR